LLHWFAAVCILSVVSYCNKNYYTVEIILQKPEIHFYRATLD